MEKIYNKILIAKYSNINKCFVQDGIELIVKPLISPPIREHINHYFVSIKDFKTKSKYGWVKIVDFFTLEEFIISHFLNIKISENDKMTIKTMFDSIDKLNEGTPVASTYSCRGIEIKKMELTIHKVFFYNKKI
ncbi:MAG: hypothetical protein RO257_03900 [Candidatus Kapabacteria bacterium]|nr:hypothetical protein [Candidatus Kapabacteria bacterium]